MRRLLLVLTVALVMAAMVVANVMPAFAKTNRTSDFNRCSGGGSAREAGFTGGGSNHQQHPSENSLVISGGDGTKEFGGSGGRCTYVFDVSTTCTGNI